MQAAVQADSKLRPWRFSRRIPGRFSRSQLGGKCWISRSWSVRKRITFLPPSPLRAAFAGAERLVQPERRREHRRRGGPRPGAEQLFAGQAAFAALLIGHLILLKTSTALLSCGGRVDVAAVGADDDRAGPAERPAQGAAVDLRRRDAAACARLLGDDARFGVAVEDVDRAGLEGGDVDAGAVGGDVEPLGRLHRDAEGAAGRAQEDGAAVRAGRPFAAGTVSLPGPFSFDFRVPDRAAG